MSCRQKITFVLDFMAFFKLSVFVISTRLISRLKLDETLEKYLLTPTKIF